MNDTALSQGTSVGTSTCFPIQIEAETPFLLINEPIVERNLSAMAERTDKLGIKLRPHIKTHKMTYYAHKQLLHGASGITAAKVSEAEVMSAHGITDIFIAYPLAVTSKIERALRLMNQSRIVFGVDSAESVHLLEQATADRNLTAEVRMEIDTGLRRTGIQPERSLTLAQQIADSPHLKLTGIYTFRGAISQGKATTDLQAAGHEEGQMMVQYAELLREAGHPIIDVSVGSTPTGLYAAEIEGVTEIRPGTYIFNDRMQAAFGVAKLQDCAAAVIATVVSCPHEDLVVIDAGSKSFATDVQPNTPPLFLEGFGFILDWPDAVLERLSEEHGMVRMPSGHSLRVGDRLAVIPNHICSTLNLYNDAWIYSPQATAHQRINARGHNW